MADEKNTIINLSNIGNSQQSNLQANQQQTVSQVTENMQTVQALFKNLKEDIFEEIDIEVDDAKQKKRITNDLQKAENAFAELEKAASQSSETIDTATTSRIEEFIDHLADKDSRINKALAYVSKSSDKIKALAQSYNKVAAHFALTTIPEV